MRIVPVIMAGGSGTRLWPLSTKEQPKQFHVLSGCLTMLQVTALRHLKSGDGVVFLPPIVVSNRSHEQVIHDQLAEIGIEPLAVLLEPVGRGTAAVAFIAARLVEAIAPGAKVLLLPADHIINNRDAFRASIAIAATIPDRITCLGITPAGPDTGFGYIKSGTAICEGAHTIARFTEKPSAQLADSYLKEGGSYWNAGIFVFSPEVIMSEMAAIRPDIADSANAVFDSIPRGDVRVRLNDVLFSAIPAESLDLAIMERTARSAVVPCEIGWADAGSWSELWKLSPKDYWHNSVRGDVVTIDTCGSLVWASNDIQVGVVGLHDIVVVATRTGVVVLPKSRAQDIKSVVDGFLPERASRDNLEA